MKSIVRQTVTFCAAMSCTLGGIAAKLQAADGIQFSKPDVEIARPPVINPNLPPERENRQRMDFSKSPAAAVPGASIVARPEMSPTRAERRTLLDQPDIFGDDPKTEDDGEAERDRAGFQRRESVKQSMLRAAPSPRSDSRQRSEDQQALSPIQEFNREPGGYEGDEQDELSKAQPGGSRVFERLNTEPQWSLPTVRESPFDLSPREFLFFGSTDKEEKPEWTPEQIGRRDDFDRLLKSGSDVPRAAAGSLDPISSLFETPKPPPASLVKPAPAPEKVSAFNPVPQPFSVGPQDHRAGAGLEDITRKFVGARAGTSQAPLDPARAQVPLMKQPTRLDFPPRTF